ncbi:hypothetical protein R1T08_03875 [Streptomyces sp. SBC-4]|nr:hypothetical protein [Streptomyces sp. SBC-4]MDV5143450.1 hypothetical protein [Streptomyces sp. SBC-4]
MSGIGELTDTHIDGHHVIATGPHLLISRHRDAGELPETVIECLDERTQPVYSRPGAVYLNIRSDHAEPTATTVRAALAGTLGVPHQAREVRLHRFSNADGPYWAADPDFHTDGTFTALHLYPATDIRPNSGYADATRPFLNTLLAHKRAHGLARRDEFEHATGTDVDADAATSSSTPPARTSTPSSPRSPPGPRNWSRSTPRLPPTCASRSTPRSPRTRPRWSGPATRRACSSPAPSPSTPARSSTRAAPRTCSGG